MRQSNARAHNGNMLLLSGWLFADLFLVLVVLFFATNVLDLRSIRATTPTPKPIPTTLPRLELQKRRFTLQIDANGLLQDSPDAVNSIKQQVQGQVFLHDRSVGLAITYGGAANDGQIGPALTIAAKVYAILKSLGKAFNRASFYDPLYVFGSDLNTVVIDIYLFAR